MTDHFAIRSLPLLLRTNELRGTHLKNRLDRRTTHHVDDLINGTLSLLNKLNHR